MAKASGRGAVRSSAVVSGTLDAAAAMTVIPCPFGNSDKELSRSGAFVSAGRYRSDPCYVCSFCSYTVCVRCYDLRQRLHQQTEDESSPAFWRRFEARKKQKRKLKQLKEKEGKGEGEAEDLSRHENNPPTSATVGSSGQERQRNESDANRNIQGRGNDNTTLGMEDTDDEEDSAVVADLRASREQRLLEDACELPQGSHPGGEERQESDQTRKQEEEEEGVGTGSAPPPPPVDEGRELEDLTLPKDVDEWDFTDIPSFDAASSSGRCSSRSGGSGCGVTTNEKNTGGDEAVNLESTRGAATITADTEANTKGNEAHTGNGNSKRSSSCPQKSSELESSSDAEDKAEPEDENDRYRSAPHKQDNRTLRCPFCRDRDASYLILHDPLVVTWNCEGPNGSKMRQRAHHAWDDYSRNLYARLRQEVAARAKKLHLLRILFEGEATQSELDRLSRELFRKFGERDPQGSSDNPNAHGFGQEGLARHGSSSGGGRGSLSPPSCLEGSAFFVSAENPGLERKLIVCGVNTMNCRTMRAGAVPLPTIVPLAVWICPPSIAKIKNKRSVFVLRIPPYIYPWCQSIRIYTEHGFQNAKAHHQQMQPQLGNTSSAVPTNVSAGVLQQLLGGSIGQLTHLLAAPADGAVLAKGYHHEHPSSSNHHEGGANSDFGLLLTVAIVHRLQLHMSRAEENWRYHFLGQLASGMPQLANLGLFSKATHYRGGRQERGEGHSNPSSETLSVVSAMELEAQKVHGANNWQLALLSDRLAVHRRNVAVFGVGSKFHLLRTVVSMESLRHCAITEVLGFSSRGDVEVTFRYLERHILPHFLRARQEQRQQLSVQGRRSVRTRSDNATMTPGRSRAQPNLVSFGESSAGAMQHQGQSQGQGGTSVDDAIPIFSQLAGTPKAHNGERKPQDGRDEQLPLTGSLAMTCNRWAGNSERIKPNLPVPSVALSCCAVGNSPGGEGVPLGRMNDIAVASARQALGVGGGSGSASGVYLPVRRTNFFGQGTDESTTQQGGYFGTPYMVFADAALQTTMNNKRQEPLTASTSIRKRPRHDDPTGGGDEKDVMHYSSPVPHTPMPKRPLDHSSPGSARGERLLVLVHNIDLLAERHLETLTELMRLHGREDLLLLCSFDNPRWPSLCPSALAAALQLDTVHCSTFLPRNMEMFVHRSCAASGIGFEGESDEVAVLHGRTLPMADTVRRVLVSLTETHRKRYLPLILDYQAEVGANHLMHIEDLRNFMEKHNIFWTAKQIRDIVLELDSQRIAHVVKAGSWALRILQYNLVRQILTELAEQEQEQVQHHGPPQQDKPKLAVQAEGR